MPLVASKTKRCRRYWVFWEGLGNHHLDCFSSHVKLNQIAPSPMQHAKPEPQANGCQYKRTQFPLFVSRFFFLLFACLSSSQLSLFTSKLVDFLLFFSSCFTSSKSTTARWCSFPLRVHNALQPMTSTRVDRAALVLLTSVRCSITAWLALRSPDAPPLRGYRDARVHDGDLSVA